MKYRVEIKTSSGWQRYGQAQGSHEYCKGWLHALNMSSDWDQLGVKEARVIGEDGIVVDRVYGA